MAKKTKKVARKLTPAQRRKGALLLDTTRMALGQIEQAFDWLEHAGVRVLTIDLLREAHPLRMPRGNVITGMRLNVECPAAMAGKPGSSKVQCVVMKDRCFSYGPGSGKTWTADASDL